MKMRLFYLISLVLATCSGFAATETLNLPTGYSLIADHLDASGGNTLNNVLPNPPLGTRLYKWSCGAWVARQFDPDDLAWTPDGLVTLNPGEGAMIWLPSATTITFTVTPHVLVPVTLPCGCDTLNLLSRQTTDTPTTYYDLTGRPPAEGAKVYRYNTLNQCPPDSPQTPGCYTLYTFSGGAWGPSPPTLNMGESAFVYVPCDTNYSYKTTIRGCCSLIANQLDKPGGNTLANIMPSLPCDARFMKWDNVSQGWITTTYSTAAGWANGSITLNPGEGAFLCPCCGTNFTITFSGQPHVPVLPINILNGNSYLLSRQVPDLGNYDNIVGLTPDDFSYVYKWDDTNCMWRQPFLYFGGTWDPTDPIAAVGEAMVISPSGGLLPEVPDVPCPTNCLTNVVILNTGFNHPAGTTYSIGAADAFWRVVDDQDSNTHELRDATVVAKLPGAWHDPEANSQWISSEPTAANNINGTYTFETQFCLEPGWSNVVLTLCVRADDAATVFLNGASILSVPEGSLWYNSNAVCVTVSTPALFKALPDHNFLTVVVTNLHGVAMGLDVVGRVTGSGLALEQPWCCQPWASLSGQKFNDQNGNGGWDTGEPVLSGWPIYLFRGTNQVAGTTTDGHGFYYFLDLPAGTYTMSEASQPCWLQTAPPGGSYTLTLTNAQASTRLNFGNQPCVQIHCPGDLVTNCVGTAGTPVPFTVTASSLCGGNVTVVCTPPSPGPFSVGTTTVHCVATNTAGCTNTCNFNVTVVDTNAPVIHCPSNIEVISCTNLPVFYTVTATNLCCPKDVTVVCTPPSGSVFTSGTTTTVHCVATNDCNTNFATCDFTVTVRMTNCCLTLTNELVICNPDGTYTYTFDLRNDADWDVGWISLTEVNGNPVFQNPFIQLTPTLLPHHTRHGLTETITGAPCGPLCFYILLYPPTFTNCCDELHCVTLPPCCPPRTYTTYSDFTNGVLMNLTNYNGTLRFPQYITPFPYVNIACSGRGTFVRIDANATDPTKAVLGEYKTAPASDYPNYYPSPSRTTVDLKGNVWVANRIDTYRVPGKPQGTVTRFALVIGGTRGTKTGPPDSNGHYHVTPDSNGEYLEGPFLYDSGTQDRDHDGLIHTSKGLGDIFPWTGPENGLNGQVTTADDECIINYTTILPTGTRTIAVDANNDVWVGGLNNRWHEKLNGLSAMAFAGSAFLGTKVGYAVPGGYGGLIDGNNVLWSSGDGMGLLRRVLPPVGGNGSPGGINKGLNLGSLHGWYGLGIDPCLGNIWHTSSSGNRVSEWAPSGVWIASYAAGFAGNPSGTTSQGVAVDDRGNVWIAHGLGNKTVGHLLARNFGSYLAGALVGAVDLTQLYPVTGGGPFPVPGPHGPTGVAIDSNGKVWVSCNDSSKAMRIDPDAGAASLDRHVGAVDLVVNLGAGASPYNYSDLTGFNAIGVTGPAGFWDFVQDSCAAGTMWGVLSWTVCQGTHIKVEVRAADRVVDLVTRSWRTAYNGVSSGHNSVSLCGIWPPWWQISGQHLEVRVTLYRGTPPCEPSRACLESLTVQCCPGNGIWINWPWAVSVSNAVPLTTNLPAVVTHPEGLSMDVVWSVNGLGVQTNQIPAGPAPTETTIDFIHTYEPGSNWVQLTVQDSISNLVDASTAVIVGDVSAPHWEAVGGYTTNAFVGLIPDAISDVDTNVLGDDWAAFQQISVLQVPLAGTVVTQGTYMITLVASDPAGNFSTNITGLTVGPVLSITSPSEYASFLATTGTPVTVQIVSNVTDVVRVNYYLDDNLVATSGDAPFGVILTNVAAGGYSLIAEAVNPDGLTSRSESVAVFFLSPESASIQIERMTNGVVLSWPAGWTLQRAGIVTGTWSDVSGAASPYTVTTNAAPQFFRLRVGP